MRRNSSITSSGGIGSTFLDDEVPRRLRLFLRFGGYCDERPRPRSQYLIFIRCNIIIIIIIIVGRRKDSKKSNDSRG